MIPEHMLEKRSGTEKVVLRSWMFTCRRMKLDPYLNQIAQKINPKWVKNMKHETLSY